MPRTPLGMSSNASSAYDQWRAKARAVRIEDEIERRGIPLKRVGSERIGPCPKCGGDDRFSINTSKQVFNCRGCGARGEVIDLVMFLDSVGFRGRSRLKAIRYSVTSSGA